MMNYTYLNRINELNDLKKLSTDKLYFLAEEIRDLLVNKISKTGGHFGSNLGLIELTIALHYVFNSPVDKIVFDVSHQTYTHKILTGRKDLFLKEENYSKTSGFTNYLENENDLFTLGHTSTSISLALGLAKNRDLNSENYNVIALIGDGSLSGGVSFEAISNAGLLNSNFIIILNDNLMSIAENHGSLYNVLKRLREDKKYRDSELNFFKQLGFDYKYEENGNNILKLIEGFKNIKDIKKPIVFHIKTEKGHGYPLSYLDKENYHYKMPFNVENGVNKYMPLETFESTNLEYFKAQLEENKNICLITAGTPKNFNFNSELREEYKDRFIDVGISEDHALLYACAIGKGKTKPVISISSSFIQRGFDQIAHEIGLNKPNMICLVDFSGISKTSATHQGVFDVTMLSNIPSITYLSPSSKEEYISMLNYTLNNEGTYFIRLQNGALNHNDFSINKENLYKFEYLKKEEDIAIIGIGKLYNLALNLNKKLNENNIKSSVFITHQLSILDEGFLLDLIKTHKTVITLEDCYVEGGFGAKIASFLSKYNIRVMNYGLKKTYIDNVDLNDIYKENKLDVDLILKDLLILK